MDLTHSENVRTELYRNFYCKRNFTPGRQLSARFAVHFPL
jgi:hypothetical protein